MVQCTNNIFFFWISRKNEKLSDAITNYGVTLANWLVNLLLYFAYVHLLNNIHIVSILQKKEKSVYNYKILVSSVCGITHFVLYLDLPVYKILKQSNKNCDLYDNYRHTHKHIHAHKYTHIYRKSFQSRLNQILTVISYQKVPEAWELGIFPYRSRGWKDLCECACISE